jgi:hypothetical protein
VGNSSGGFFRAGRISPATPACSRRSPRNYSSPHDNLLDRPSSPGNGPPLRLPTLSPQSLARLLTEPGSLVMVTISRIANRRSSDRRGVRRRRQPREFRYKSPGRLDHVPASIGVALSCGPEPSCRGGLDLDNSADRRITPVRWPRALRPACRGRSSGSARRACRPARRLNVHCRRLLKDRLQRDDRGDCGLDFGRDGNRLRLGRCGKRVFSPLMLYRPGHRSDSGVSLASSDNPDRAKVCR